MKKLIQLLGLLTIFFLTSCNNNQNRKENGYNPKLTNKIQADSNNTKQTIGKGEKKFNTCLDVVFEILTTSPTYLKKTKGLNEAIVKNGGNSFGITVEGSPNPKKDDAMEYSENYEFNLHETYSERTTVITRFKFNLSDRKLYEYDAAEDKLNPIDFDQKLLVKFDEICK